MELSEDDVLHILKLIDESKFDYFQLEVGELKITVSKGDPIPLGNSAPPVAISAAPAVSAPAVAPKPAPAPAASAPRQKPQRFPPDMSPSRHRSLELSTWRPSPERRHL